MVTFFPSISASEISPVNRLMYSVAFVLGIPARMASFSVRSFLLRPGGLFDTRFVAIMVLMVKIESKLWTAYCIFSQFYSRSPKEHSS